MKRILRWLYRWLNLGDDVAPLQASTAPFPRFHDDSEFHRRALESSRKVKAFFNQRPRPWR